MPKRENKNRGIIQGTTPFMGAYLELAFNKAKPFKSFIKLLGQEKKNLWLATIFLIIKHSPVWVLPLTTAEIINVLTSQEGDVLFKILFNLSLMLFLILQNIPTHTLYVKYLALSSRELEAQLRTALIIRLQQLSISFHEEYRSGKIQAKVLRDVDSILNMITQLFSNVILAIITVIFAISITLIRKPLMSFFFIIVIPTAVLLMHLFRQRMQFNNMQLRLSIERMSARINEMIEMIQVTRAHGLEDVEIKNMNKHMRRVKKHGIKLDVINAVFGSTSWAIFQLFQLACLGITAFLALNKFLPVGDVVLYQSFFNQILSSVNFIIAIYPQLAKGYDAFVSLGDILQNPDLEQIAGKYQVTSVKGNFEFQNVYFKYPRTNSHALKGVSFKVKAGECLAIVGESGSGKSTLMQLIMGFHRPQRGRILLDGIDLAEIDLKSFRQFLSVVPQNTILFTGSIKENISYGLKNVSEDQIQMAIAVANATEFINKLPEGLDTIIGEGGVNLSGGQRQRLAIARAVIRNPRIIILDEATSALDVIAEKQVQNALRKLIKGRTTFIVAHRLSTIRKANRIIVMKKGKIIEAGTLSELLKKKGEFYRLKSLQE